MATPSPRTMQINGEIPLISSARSCCSDSVQSGARDLSRKRMRRDAVLIRREAHLFSTELYACRDDYQLSVRISYSVAAGVKYVLITIWCQHTLPVSPAKT